MRNSRGIAQNVSELGGIDISMNSDKSAMVLSGEDALAHTYRQVCVEDYVLKVLDEKLE